MGHHREIVAVQGDIKDSYRTTYLLKLENEVRQSPGQGYPPCTYSNQGHILHALACFDDLMADTSEGTLDGGGIHEFSLHNKIPIGHAFAPSTFFGSLGTQKTSAA